MLHSLYFGFKQITVLLFVIPNVTQYIFENNKYLPHTNKISSICLHFFWYKCNINSLLKIVIIRLIFYVFQLIFNLNILYFVNLQTKLYNAYHVSLMVNHIIYTYLFITSVHFFLQKNISYEPKYI
jgi:hypothetical protein